MWWLGGKKVPINLGLELSVEVHNHVLPGLDDGARSMQDALQMMFFWVEWVIKKLLLRLTIALTFLLKVQT